ncbi:hypothetical protein MSH26_01195 [bacterium]|nr:hypothetical protein [bacterium]
MKHTNKNKIFMYFVVTILMLTGFCLILTKYGKYLNRKDANVKVDNSYYKLAINNNNSNIIKVSKKTQNLTNITLTSLNEETKNYELSYTLYTNKTCTKEVKDKNVKVEYSSKTVDNPQGTINNQEEKYIRVFINNQSNKDYYLKLNLKSKKNNDTIIADKYEEGNDLLAAYIDGISSSSYPTSSSYNAEVICRTTGVNDDNSTAWGNATWNGSKWIANIYDITVGNTKCTTYFTTKYSYANAPSGTLLYKIRTSYTADGASTKTTPGKANATANEGVRTSPDDYGTSYYYRGNINNNYVEFANMCWRILRVTGNGDIKLVLYNGNAESVNNPCSNVKSVYAPFSYYKMGSSTNYHYKAFNSLDTGYVYTGFMYGPETDITVNSTDSIALSSLKGFYDQFLRKYNSMIADTIYCGDKSGTTASNVLSRIYRSPTLTCPADAKGGKAGSYTATDIVNGNGKLRGNDGYGSKPYKIGLLSADEVAFAGLTTSSANTSTFLGYSAEGDTYWTMSSAGNGSPYEVFFVKDGTSIDYDILTERHYIRPVIALLSSTKVTGSGTKTDPFVVN